MTHPFEEVLASDASRICVIAGPGTGKTRGILLPKLRQLLEGGVDASQLLLLSFSRLSAEDLRKRAADLPGMVRASTVHSYALSFLLSEDSHEIRKRIESILFPFERDILLSDLKVVLGRDKRELSRALDEFSAGWAIRPHDEVFEDTPEHRAFKAAIVHWLDEHVAAMMEEIVHHAVSLGRANPDATFLAVPRFILVDEYQDLNELEQQFVRQLAADSDLLLAVGDPDQSIYSFKYAHPEGIRSLAREDGVFARNHMITRRCAKKIANYAAQLLQQEEPSRTDLLVSDPSQPEGEVRFLTCATQEIEFREVLGSLAARLAAGASPDSVMVLVPRKKLGEQFAGYVKTHRDEVGVPADVRVSALVKQELDNDLKRRLLILALLVNPESPLRRRSLAGLGDDSYFAKEFATLKTRYGGLEKALASTNPEDFPRTARRVRSLCIAIREIDAQLREFEGKTPAEVVDTLFPPDSEGVLKSLREICGDTEDADLSDIYRTLLDSLRTLPGDQNTVRVMSLIASKGLDADHVYILGCSAGNLPGENRSVHLNEEEFKSEQRRLLYVGMTRAKQSLTISWSKRIPFRQSMSHHTATVGTRRGANGAQSLVTLSPFLQDLAGANWESQSR